MRRTLAAERAEAAKESALADADDVTMGGLDAELVVMSGGGVVPVVDSGDVRPNGRTNQASFPVEYDSCV